MELVLATGNRDKQREMKAFLRDLGITIRTLDEFPGAPVVLEDGETCRANAGKKAVEIAMFTGTLALADDTGLEVDALGGQPGVFAARYAGPQATYADNCRKLLDELEGVPSDQRGARFLTVVAISDPSSSVEFVEGVLRGRIADHCSGGHGFGYDPVFMLPELGKTLAELTLDQKNQISHRGRALAKAKDVLKRILGRNIGA
ncbi:MAG: RdgB/HAM1 family non-canonical purine NTP pyrophosphatase [Nitrospira sp.]|nr:RdgB/HAM1 family non-canonical purine NTP pyrophosphatase [Nitrospira sp.]